MKTTKIISTAILVLLTFTTFAQTDKGLIVTVEYSHELNRFETWVSHLHDRFSHNGSNAPALPVISQSFYSEYTEISYDMESTIENWMIAPFGEVIAERDLLIEEWMTKPFYPSAEEEDLYLEEWMTRNFWE